MWKLPCLFCVTEQKNISESPLSNWHDYKSSFTFYCSVQSSYFVYFFLCAVLCNMSIVIYYAVYWVFSHEAHSIGQRSLYCRIGNKGSYTEMWRLKKERQVLLPLWELESVHCNGHLIAWGDLHALLSCPVHDKQSGMISVVIHLQERI